MTEIFEFSNHFAYLKARLESSQLGRGSKARLSDHLRIQPAFLSQVLAGKYALSLEQADATNAFLDHSSEEAEFFLALVSKDRAGTVSLKKHYTKQIESMLAKRQLLIERLGRRGTLSEEVKGVFFSSWLYAAVQVACTIDRLRTRKALAQEFGFSRDLIGHVLDFLEANQLLRKHGDQYLPTQIWIGLAKDSPHIVKHHSNWRQKAIQSLEAQDKEELHFSGVYSIDKQSAAKFKDNLTEFISQQMKAFESAPEHELFAVTLDFFKPKTNRTE